MSISAIVPLFIVAAVIADDHGRVLLVRKRGSGVFIQPGGKRESHENPLPALARELREELGVDLIVESAERLGEFEAEAVHERGRTVRAEVFIVRIDGEPRPQAEIVELAWMSPRAPYPFPVAPLSSEQILPRFLARSGAHRAA